MARFATLSFAISLFLVPFVTAQYTVATKIVRAAVDRLGGESKIRSLKSIYFSGTGFEDSSVNAQPYEFGKPARNRHEEKLAVFLDGRRLAYELKTDRGDGTTRHRRFYFPDSRRIVADLVTRSVYSSNVQSPSVDRDQYARRIPHTFLLEVLANSSKLRRKGSAEINGREHEVLSITLPNAKVPIDLYFERYTNLLTKYEFTMDFPGLGMSKVEYTFDGYRAHPRLGFFPTMQRIRINGTDFRSVTFDQILADSAVADEMLELPPDLEGFVTPAGTVKEIAKNIFFVYGVQGFQPMFVEFKDFVVAIEAPSIVPVLEETPVASVGNMNSASEEFIAKIRQRVPSKPIKYVVVTHGHADHFGGLRAFLSEHPIVLTTPGSREYIQKFVPELKVETIAERRSIIDSETSIQLINVGRNPHTDENLIAYFPKEKYLFQGDLFYFNSEATFPAKDRMTVMPFFAKWLKANGLSPDRIYGFHSTMFGTMEHIEKILKLSSQTSQL
jgi:glyoxylase-like metal-dependent hydrolase (beta-lactamase superfamily II)